MNPNGMFWLASYMKSGNTWLRAFLANLKADLPQPIQINSLNVGTIASSREWLDDILGFDCEEATDQEIHFLRPYVYHWANKEEGGITYHKIHDAFTNSPNGKPVISLEATLGVVYLIRNPLDIAPSLANHHGCDINTAIQYMADKNRTSHTPYAITHQVSQFLSSWSGHVESWLDGQGFPLLAIRYEDMVAHPLTTFTTIATFLRLPNHEHAVAKAIRFSDFNELSRQEEENGFRERPVHAKKFFRQGKPGHWRHVLTPQQVKTILQDHAPVMHRCGYLDDNFDPV